MKTYIRSLLLVLGFGLLAASCSVQKRQYLPGYHVSWKHARQHVEQQQAAAKPDAPSSAEATTIGEALAAETQAATSQKESAEAPAPVAKNKSSHRPEHKVSESTGLALNPVKKDPVIRIAIREMKSAAAADDTRVNGFAIAGLVCGIVALFAFYGAFVLGVLAVIFSAIALNKIRSSGERGRMMAIAGLICGIVAIAIIATIVTVMAI